MKKPPPNVQAFQAVLKKNKEVDKKKKVKIKKQNSRTDEFLKKHESIFRPSCRMACRQCERWSTKSKSTMKGSHLNGHFTNCILWSWKWKISMLKIFSRIWNFEGVCRRTVHHSPP